MPPAKKKPGKFRYGKGCGIYHHVVWVRRLDGMVSRQCAHCPTVIGVHEELRDKEAVMLACQHSDDAHKTACGGRRIGESFSDSAKWKA